MPHLIFADDLTGANATGAALRATGASVVTGLQLMEAASTDFFLLNTHTRERTDATAYRMIREHIEAARSLGGFRIFGRRVDSTLRGPISGEIEGLLNAFPDARIAFVPSTTTHTAKTLHKRTFKLLIFINRPPILPASPIRCPL